MLAKAGALANWTTARGWGGRGAWAPASGAAAWIAFTRAQLSWTNCWMAASKLSIFCCCAMTWFLLASHCARSLISNESWMVKIEKGLEPVFFVYCLQKRRSSSFWSYFGCRFANLACSSTFARRKHVTMFNNYLCFACWNDGCPWSMFSVGIK